MPFLSSAARAAVSFPGGISLSGDIVISGSDTNNVLQWRAPPGPFATRDISIVAVGGGRGYTPRVPGVSDGSSGSGGNLRYYNDYEVVPNKFYEIAAGKRGTEFNTNGGASYFKDGDTVVVTSGGLTDSYGIQLPSETGGSIGGGNGASGTIQENDKSIDSGGGGAGGYSGDGGTGGGFLFGGSPGSGGGGAGGRPQTDIDSGSQPAIIGGGVGLYGIGASGTPSSSNVSLTQGSLGSNGVYGGGAGNLITGAAPGGLRIVWGTNYARQFPSTNVRQTNDYVPLIYTSPTTGTYVVPEGVTSLAFIVVGAGGGSDTVYQSSNRASGGGGAGGVVYVYDVDVDLGDIIEYSVGEGGAGGTPSSVGGKTGGESYVRLTDAATFGNNFNYRARGGTGASGSSAGNQGDIPFSGPNGTALRPTRSYFATLGVNGAGGYGGNGGAPPGLTSIVPPAAPANSGGYAGAGFRFDLGSYSTASAAINPLGGSTGEGYTNTLGAGAGAGGPFSGSFFPDGRKGSDGAVVIFPNQLIRPFTNPFTSPLITRAGFSFYYAR